MISMIAAIGQKRELGKKNALIWKISDDMKFFKETTMNHTVIVGLNTFASFPNGLPGRKMIVITDAIEENPEKNITTTTDVKGLINKYENSEKEVIIIGGAYVYSQFVNHAKILYLTEIEATDNEADTYFPEFEKRDFNKEILKKGTDQDINYSMIKYTRKAK